MSTLSPKAVNGLATQAESQLQAYIGLRPLAAPVLLTFSASIRLRYRVALLSIHPLLYDALPALPEPLLQSLRGYGQPFRR